MWTLHQTSKVFGTRPSSLAGLADNLLLSWCFDQAVWLFGTWVENKLSEKKEVRKNGRVVGHKPRYTLGRILGTEKPGKVNRAQWRAMFGPPEKD